MRKLLPFPFFFLILLTLIVISRNKKIIPLPASFSCKSILSDSLTLFQKKVIPHRITQFIGYLQTKNIRVANEYELLLLLSNRSTRQQLAQEFQLDAELLLLHAELVDLLQIGMTEIDAQMLHFSQRNYQNPFTGATMNLHLLAKAEAESILEDIGGWAAGNENPLVENYQLSLEEIEKWMTKANESNLNFFAERP